MYIEALKIPCLAGANYVVMLLPMFAGAHESDVCSQWCPLVDKPDSVINALSQATFVMESISPRIISPDSTFICRYALVANFSTDVFPFGHVSRRLRVLLPQAHD